MYIEDLKYIDQLPKIESKIQAVFQIIEILNKLRNRSECPFCRNCLDKKLVDHELEVFNEKLKEFHLQSMKESIERQPFIEEQNRKRIAAEEKEKKDILAYMEANKSKFRKAIKDSRAGKEGDLLPNIPDNEKRLWNKAIDKFVGNSTSYDDIDSFDLMFDI